MSVSNTKLNHSPKVKVHNEPLISPIYQTAKFVINREHELKDQYIYTRISNPTTKELEFQLAHLLGKEEAVVFASGISAITVSLMGLLKSGDHVVSFKESYKPSRIFFRDYLPRFGIKSTILNLNDFETLEKILSQSSIKLIHFESPSNPNLVMTDIQRLISLAQKHQVVLTMDGTFGGLHQHQYPGIDLMIQSLTKFANGHGDVMAGVVAGKTELIQKIRTMNIFLGSTLDPHAAFLVMRGLKTYQLRFNHQNQSAHEIAQFLNQHTHVEKVFYPGLAHHPQHHLVAQQMKDSGAVVSFILKNGVTAEEFCQKLKLIQYSVSLGSTESIICPSLIFFGDDLSPTDQEQMGLNKYSLRLSVGLEDVADLIRDLKMALA
jgi:cystathionine beta-lyase/cystathionine gamma-synthase